MRYKFIIDNICIPTLLVVEQAAFILPARWSIGEVGEGTTWLLVCRLILYWFRLSLEWYWYTVSQSHTLKEEWRRFSILWTQNWSTFLHKLSSENYSGVNWRFHVSLLWIVLNFSKNMSFCGIWFPDYCIDGTVRVPGN